MVRKRMLKDGSRLDLALHRDAEPRAALFCRDPPWDRRKSEAEFVQCPLSEVVVAGRLAGCTCLGK